MTGESPTLPTILFLMPPVDVAQATLLARSTATAPTVSWALNGRQQFRFIHQRQVCKSHFRKEILETPTSFSFYKINDL